MAGREYGYPNHTELPSEHEVLEGIERELGIKRESESGNKEYLDLEKKIFKEEAATKKGREKARICAINMVWSWEPLIENGEVIDVDEIRAYVGQFRAGLNSSRERQQGRINLPGSEFTTRNLYGAIRREIARLRDVDHFLEQNRNMGRIRTFQVLRTAVFDTIIADHQRVK
jgi:hypothetical protein